MASIQNVLTAVDFSEHSLKAAQQAISVAAATGSALELIHVVSLPGHLDPYAHLGVQATEQHVTLADYAREQAEREMGEFLAELSATAAAHDVRVQTSIRFGQPAETVIARAAELSAPLLVVGTHGRSGIAHMLLGSVAERLVRMSEAPVLVVPPPEHAAD